MHPDMRLEMIMTADVASALVTGAEKLNSGSTPKNQTHIHGGGQKNGWQRLFGSLSLPVPDKKYFTQDMNTYHLDWYDTKEAQQEFDFQNNSIDDYFKHMKKTFRLFKLPITLFRKIIMKRIVKMSPYYKPVR